MALNENESKVLGLIRDNPYISQKELSQHVDLSRSSVANIISGLVQKGYLVGRAYIVNEDRPIVCIGAANIDRLYVVDDVLIQGTSNQVTSRTALGGIARNIGENLGKLELPVTLLSMVGKDDSGEAVRSASKLYMNVEHLDETGLCPTGNFTEIVDKEGNLILGLAEMAIYDQMSIKWVERHQSIIEKASFVVVDTNIPKEVLETLLSMANRMHLQIILVTTSIQKMENIPKRLDGLALVVSKHDETFYYFDIAENGEEALEEGVRKWQEAGAEKVLLLKENEKIAYSASEKHPVYIFENPTKNKDRYAWGVSEALTSGYIYAKYLDKSDEEALIYGLVNSFETSGKIHTIRTNLSQKALEKDVREFLRKNQSLPVEFSSLSLD